MNPLADTQDIKRNSTSECLYVDPVGSRSEEKKKTTTTIAFAKQSGNNDKKIKDDDKNYTAHIYILKCYPMIKKVTDSIFESFLFTVSGSADMNKDLRKKMTIVLSNYLRNNNRDRMRRRVQMQEIESGSLDK